MFPTEARDVIGLFADGAAKMSLAIVEDVIKVLHSALGNPKDRSQQPRLVWRPENASVQKNEERALFIYNYLRRKLRKEGEKIKGIFKHRAVIQITHQKKGEEMRIMRNNMRNKMVLQHSGFVHGGAMEST